jgi:hypothetical protein
MRIGCLHLLIGIPTAQRQWTSADQAAATEFGSFGPVPLTAWKPIRGQCRLPIISLCPQAAERSLTVRRRSVACVIDGGKRAACQRRDIHRWPAKRRVAHAESSCRLPVLRGSP